MKKRLILVSLFIVVVLLGGGLVLLWKAEEIATAYKPQLEEKLSQAIGADVSLGELSFTVIPSTAISVRRVSIKDKSGRPAAFSVDSLSARVALRPLLSKRLEISNVVIDSPRVTVIKDASGIVAAGLSPVHGSPTPSSSPISQTQSAKHDAPTLAIDVRSIEILNGVFVFQDKTTNTSTTITAIEAEASVGAFSNGIAIPNATISFALSGAQKFSLSLDTLTIAQPNSRIEIKSGGIRTPAGTISFSGAIDLSNAPGAITVNSTGLDLATLATLASPHVDFLTTYTPRGRADFQISAQFQGAHPLSLKGPIGIKNASINLPNSLSVSDITGKVELDGALNSLLLTTNDLQLKLQGFPLSLSSNVRVTPEEIGVQTLSIKGFGGEVRAPARLRRGAPTTLDVNTTASNISLNTALQAFKPSLAPTIRGELSSFRSDIQGLDLTNPAASAKGFGSLTARNGLLRGFNIPHQVLSSIEGIPFISGNLRSRVPPEFEPLVAKPDMVVKDLRATFTLGNAAAKFSELVVVSEIFTLQSSGSVGFDGRVDLNSEILFSPEFSLAITKKVREFKTLLDGSDQFVVPLTVRGTAPSIAIYPNVASLARKATVGTVRQAIGGAIGGGKDATKSLGKILGF